MIDNFFLVLSFCRAELVLYLKFVQKTLCFTLLFKEKQFNLTYSDVLVVSETNFPSTKTYLYNNILVLHQLSK